MESAKGAFKRLGRQNQFRIPLNLKVVYVCEYVCVKEREREREREWEREMVFDWLVATEGIRILYKSQANSHATIMLIIIYIVVWLSYIYIVGKCQLIEVSGNCKSIIVLHFK